METRTSDGIRLYWEQSGAGRPLLLIQGLGWSADMWYRMVPRLEASHRVIRYDARGVGRSDVPDGPYPVEVMGADAVSVLDAAGVDRAHVFACSLGGLVALELGLSHPERVTSLTLCCTHPGGTDTVLPDPEVLQLLMSRSEMPFEQTVRAAVHVAYAPDTDQEIIEEDIRRRLAVPTAAEGYRAQLLGGSAYAGAGSRLSGIDVPTLVITGDADQLVPLANSELLASRIPRARLVTIPGAGHVVFNERTDELCAELSSFLAEVDAGASTPG